MKNISSKNLVKSFLTLSIFAGILFFMFPRLANAQTQNIQFKRLTIDDGLSQSWVHSIIQDKYGFIWIGTDDGLNRYDGTNFRIYKSEPRNKYSLSSSNIAYLFEDSRGELWIGTRLGLNFYDRQNDQFIQYSPVSQGIILSIVEDKDRNLWISTNVNLYRINLENDSLYLYDNNSIFREINQTVTGGYNAMYVDSKNNLWIGSSNGLLLYDKEKDSFINYPHDDKNSNSLSSDNVRSILEDRSGRLWVGTANGLDLFTNAKERPSKGVFVHYQNNADDKNSITKGMVLALLESDKNILWIGTENGGLDLLNLNTYKKDRNSFVHFKNDPNRAASLTNNSIYSLFQDKQGNIWIGTYSSGINIVNPVSDKFIHIKNEPGIKNSLSSNQVFAFLEDDNYLWICTDGGLNRYNKKDDTFKHYVNDPSNKKSISSNSTLTICKDKRGDMWIGTWGGGLNRFDYRTETFEYYLNDPKDTNSIGSNNLFSVFVDSDENLWIGTMGGGLNMFDKKSKKFIRYNTLNSGISTNYVQAIIEAKNGDLWLSNTNSFERFNRTTKIFEHFTYSETNSTSLSSNKVISIFEDSKGNLWMGTAAGLNLFDKSTKGFKVYQMEDGLPNNAINSICEDDGGNLWIGTNRGLSKFIGAINLPAKPEFKNYSYGDGLQSNGFGKRSCLRGSDGAMYFGGSNGFNMFDPDKITENTYIPPIVITDFQIFNRPVPIGKKGSPLQKSISSTEELVLSYTQSVFSFEFAALNYISSAKNEFAYKMEGFDKDWNYSGTKYTATYTNLDPGKYIFRVKGSNNDGVWNEKGVALPIVITPPFWKTWLFYAFCAIIIISAIVGSYRYRIYRVRENERKLKRNVEERTRELALEIAEHQKAEESLEHERNLFRLLIDNLPDSIYIKDLKYRKTVANIADLRILGRQAESEVLGKTDFDFYPREIAEAFNNDDRLVIQTGRSVLNREEYLFDENGKKRWLLTSKLPLRDEKGQIIGLIGIGHDITNRKRAEEALHESEERFRIVAEQTGQLVYDYRLDSGVIKWAGAIQEVTGYSPNDIQNSMISDWRKNIHPEDRDSVISLLEDARKTFRHYLIEYRVRRMDGEYFYVEDRGLFLKDELGAAQRVLGAIANITERKTASLERERLITELQNAVADIKVLSGLVPICSSCKKIRDDKGYWTQLEGYIQAHSQAKFSHGVCPECMEKLYPDFMTKKRTEGEH